MHAKTLKTYTKGTVTLAGVVGVLLACGGTFEPTPDIPEHVEYETVCIAYSANGTCNDAEPESGMMQQALVGQKSTLAKFTGETVTTTNRILRDQFKLVDDITSNPPSSTSEGRWIWEHTKPAKQQYFRFEIHTRAKPEDDATVQSAYRYLFYVGRSKSDHELFYSAEFYQFAPSDKQTYQQGFGIVRFFFDDIKKYDESMPDGRIRISFRSKNQVRQVRVAFSRVKGAKATDALSALYQYTQLPGGQGRLSYFGRGDFEEDGRPFESLGAQAAWTSKQEGHIAARLSGGSLKVDELLVRECWDAQAITTFARSMPTIPEYDGGTLEDCAIPLQTVELSPPSPGPSDVDPIIPPVHPLE